MSAALSALALGSLLVGACGDDGSERSDQSDRSDLGDAADTTAQDADTGAPVSSSVDRADGSPCDDGDPCTMGEGCAGGRCAAGTATSCEGGDDCRVARCEPGVGCVTEPAADGAPCQAPCFEDGQCQAGICEGVPGREVVCPPPNDPCVAERACDPATQACTLATPAAAGTPCDLDDDVCTLDACDGAGGCTVTGAVDGCVAESVANPCWTYTCVKKAGCAKTNFIAGASCDDNNACTYNDTCLVGDLGQKTCLGTVVPIDDGNLCTDDACAEGVVTHAPIDGIVCQLPDDLCHGVGVCASGACVAPSVVDCDDDDPCTVDACDPETGQCDHPAAADGGACDDGDACTGPDLCSGGQCIGATIGDCCGNGVCELGEGCDCADCDGESCVPEGACVGGAVCTAGACVGAPQPGCCGNGVCELGEGCDCADCDGESCVPEGVCVDGGVCTAGACVGAPQPDCCGNGVCEAGEDCACGDCDGAPCSDDDACTDADTCSAGACVGVAIPGCQPPLDDGEACTDNANCQHTCVGALCAPRASAGEPCDPGDSADCTAGLVCAGGLSRKLTASDAAEGDQFGGAVSIDGDTAVVTARFDDDGADDSGSAYVFVRSGATWTQQAKLTASDGAASDLLGVAASVSGDTAVVGAYLEDGAGIDYGAAYVFVRSGTTWTQQAKLTASDAEQGDLFGYTVSIDGDTAIVGAVNSNPLGDNSGSVYVFVRSGATWTRQAKLTPSDAAEGDKFGVSVSLHGDTALIGAYHDDDRGYNAGAAYVFVRGGATWTQEAKLTASDGASGDWFGDLVSLYADTAVVTTMLDQDAGSHSGSAYVFVRSGTSWTQQAKLTASDAAADDWFGDSVSVYGDTVLVGSFRKDLAGAGTSAGAAYVFVRSGATWTQQAKLTALDTTSGDELGSWVSLSGDTAVVGAHADADAGFRSGSAYVFTRTGASWTQSSWPSTSSVCEP